LLYIPFVRLWQISMPIDCVNNTANDINCPFDVTLILINNSSLAVTFINIFYLFEPPKVGKVKHAINSCNTHDNIKKLWLKDVLKYAPQSKV